MGRSPSPRRRKKSINSQQSETTSYTYILEAEGSGSVKIGNTKSLGAHISRLQADNPYPLKLRRKIRGLQHKKFLQRLLSGHHQRGDWYSLNKDSALLVDRYHRDDPHFYPLLPRPADQPLVEGSS